MASPSNTLRAVGPAWKPEHLPAFPTIALKALQMIAGRDTSLLELCNLIRSDAEFSSAILKIANSPLIAFSKNITSILQASMLLGFRRLKCVVVTVGLREYLKAPFTPVMQSCWRHSVACAMIAERAATSCKLDRDFAYTAGVLHDIGRVAMVTTMPDTYARVVENEADRPQDLLARERELFGVDHSEAGAAIVRAWNLPAAFLEITSGHHAEGTRCAGTASVIAPSCLLADVLGFRVAHYRGLRGYADIVRTFPSATWEQFPAQPEKFIAEITDEIRVIEAV
ncbi:MAG: HDOD domain-containing protein [Terriglobales bacterium]